MRFELTAFFAEMCRLGDNLGAILGLRALLIHKGAKPPLNAITVLQV